MAYIDINKINSFYSEMGSDLDIFKEIFSAFYDTYSELKKIDNFTSGSGVFGLAHQIKGSALHFGANNLNSLSFKLEQSTNQDIDSIKKLYQETLVEYDSVLSEIQKWIDSIS